jgi:hypothetical protein
MYHSFTPSKQTTRTKPCCTGVATIYFSSKPTMQFTSIKTLKEVANVHPPVGSQCNDALEALMGNANCSIETLATWMKSIPDTTEISHKKNVHQIINGLCNHIPVNAALLVDQSSVIPLLSLLLSYISTMKHTGPKPPKPLPLVLKQSSRNQLLPYQNH